MTLRPLAPLGWCCLAAGVAACADAGAGLDPIFVEGRAVAPAGDSAIAMTFSGRPGLLVRNRRRGEPVVLGAQSLRSPAHAQWYDGRWFVSDVEDGKAVLVELAPDGTVRRRTPLARYTNTPHQFAVLPGGGVVIEGTEAALLTLTGDSVTTFAETEQSARTGLLIAASGGVLHAVPDRHLTLYNEFGRIRWRSQWPWASTAYVTDLAVDAHGRIHVIAGVPQNNTFVVYTLSSQTGEVLRWSTPGPTGTWVVDRLGEIRPDSPGRWTE